MSESHSNSPIINQFKQHEKDTGSCEVQVVLLSQKIAHLTEHLRTHKKDLHSRRGLILMTSRRRRLLDYLRQRDIAKYNLLIQELKLRR